jgi:pyrroline-5-carboxylate reductase
VRRSRVKAAVFLGGGRITSALVAGLRLASSKTPIIVHDRNAKKLRQLQRQYGVFPEPDLNRAVARAGLLIVAVRPDSVRQLLASIGGIKQPLAAINVAAGISLSTLRAQLGKPVMWARAMPSPTCRVRRGLTALAYSRAMPAAARKRVHDLFASVGEVLDLSETKFDAFTVTYSVSHGYHAVATLARAAQRIGLDRRTALTAAAHAMAAGMLAWRQGDSSLEELLQEAATPGGIAACVMNALESAGYDQIVEKALRAGLATAKRNASR